MARKLSISVAVTAECTMGWLSSTPSDESPVWTLSSMDEKKLDWRRKAVGMPYRVLSIRKIIWSK